MTERVVEGTILAGEALEPTEGRLVLADGTIEAIEEGAVASDDIVCPAFINAHTHVGDAVAKDAGVNLSLEALVAPPDGLKHRTLAAASDEAVVEAMAGTLRLMETSGTGVCYDFREGGDHGVSLLRRAAADRRLDVQAFGRGDPAVLDVADGYGASGAADADFAAARRAAREAGKPFAIHAGEVDDTDIDPALDLEPDLLVHMVHPRSGHLERLAEAPVPVVCCPRANLATGVGVPPIDALVERTSVALGTDNVMTSSPSMFRELAVASMVCDLEPSTVLRMATVAPARIFDRADGVLAPGRPARLFVLDGESDNLAGTADPVAAVVRRADRADVSDVILSPIRPES